MPTPWMLQIVQLEQGGATTMRTAWLQLKNETHTVTQ